MKDSVADAGARVRDTQATLEEGAGQLEASALQADYAQWSVRFAVAMAAWMVYQLMTAVAAAGGIAALLIPEVLAGARQTVREIVWALVGELRAGVVQGVGQDAATQLIQFAEYRKGWDWASAEAAAVGAAAGAAGGGVRIGWGHLPVGDAGRLLAHPVAGVAGGVASVGALAGFEGGEIDPKVLAEAIASGAVLGVVGGGVDLAHRAVMHKSGLPGGVAPWESGPHGEDLGAHVGDEKPVPPAVEYQPETPVAEPTQVVAEHPEPGAVAAAKHDPAPTHAETETATEPAGVLPTEKAAEDTGVLRSGAPADGDVTSTRDDVPTAPVPETAKSSAAGARHDADASVPAGTQKGAADGVPTAEATHRDTQAPVAKAAHGTGGAEVTAPARPAESRAEARQEAVAHAPGVVAEATGRPEGTEVHEAAVAPSEALPSDAVPLVAGPEAVGVAGVSGEVVARVDAWSRDDVEGWFAQLPDERHEELAGLVSGVSRLSLTDTAGDRLFVQQVALAGEMALAEHRGEAAPVSGGKGKAKLVAVGRRELFGEELAAWRDGARKFAESRGRALEGALPAAGPRRPSTRFESTEAGPSRPSRHSEHFSTRRPSAASTSGASAEATAVDSAGAAHQPPARPRRPRPGTIDVAFAQQRGIDRLLGRDLPQRAVALEILGYAGHTEGAVDLFPGFGDRPDSLAGLRGSAQHLVNERIMAEDQDLRRLVSTAMQVRPEDTRSLNDFVAEVAGYLSGLNSDAVRQLGDSAQDLTSAPFSPGSDHDLLSPRTPGGRKAPAELFPSTDSDKRGAYVGRSGEEARALAEWLDTAKGEQKTYLHLFGGEAMGGPAPVLWREDSSFVVLTDGPLSKEHARHLATQVIDRFKGSREIHVAVLRPESRTKSVNKAVETLKQSLAYELYARGLSDVKVTVFHAAHAVLRHVDATGGLELHVSPDKNGRLWHAEHVPAFKRPVVRFLDDGGSLNLRGDVDSFPVSEPVRLSGELRALVELSGKEAKAFVVDAAPISDRPEEIRHELALTLPLEPGSTTNPAAEAVHGLPEAPAPTRSKSRTRLGRLFGPKQTEPAPESSEVRDRHHHRVGGIKGALQAVVGGGTGKAAVRVPTLAEVGTAFVAVETASSSTVTALAARIKSDLAKRPGTPVVLMIDRAAQGVLTKDGRTVRSLAQNLADELGVHPVIATHGDIKILAAATAAGTASEGEGHVVEVLDHVTGQVLESAWDVFHPVGGLLSEPLGLHGPGLKTVEPGRYNVVILGSEQEKPSAFTRRDSHAAVFEPVEDPGYGEAFPPRVVRIPVQHDEKPALLVSQDGTIAISAEQGEIGEFYASKEVMEETKKLLTELDSRATVEVDAPKVVLRDHPDQVLYKVRLVFPDADSMKTDILTAPTAHANRSGTLLLGTGGHGAGAGDISVRLAGNGGAARGAGTVAKALVHGTEPGQAQTDSLQVAHAVAAEQRGQEAFPGHEQAYGDLLRRSEERAAKPQGKEEPFGAGLTMEDAEKRILVDRLIERLGVNQYVWPQPGESYVVQSMTGSAGEGRHPLHPSHPGPEGQSKEAAGASSYRSTVIASDKSGFAHIALESYDDQLSLKRDLGGREIATLVEEYGTHTEDAPPTWERLDTVHEDFGERLAMLKLAKGRTAAQPERVARTQARIDSVTRSLDLASEVQATGDAVHEFTRTLLADWPEGQLKPSGQQLRKLAFEMLRASHESGRADLSATVERFMKNLPPEDPRYGLSATLGKALADDEQLSAVRAQLEEELRQAEQEITSLAPEVEALAEREATSRVNSRKASHRHLFGRGEGAEPARPSGPAGLQEKEQRLEAARQRSTAARNRLAELPDVPSVEAVWRRVNASHRKAVDLYWTISEAATGSLGAGQPHLRMYGRGQAKDTFFERTVRHHDDEGRQTPHVSDPLAVRVAPDLMPEGRTVIRLDPAATGPYEDAVAYGRQFAKAALRYQSNGAGLPVIRLRMYGTTDSGPVLTEQAKFVQESVLAGVRAELHDRYPDGGAPLVPERLRFEVLHEFEAPVPTMSQQPTVRIELEDRMDVRAKELVDHILSTRDPQLVATARGHAEAIVSQYNPFPMVIEGQLEGGHYKELRSRREDAVDRVAAEWLAVRETTGNDQDALRAAIDLADQLRRDRGVAERRFAVGGEGPVAEELRTFGESSRGRQAPVRVESGESGVSGEETVGGGKWSGKTSVLTIGRRRAEAERLLGDTALPGVRDAYLSDGSTASTAQRLWREAVEEVAYRLHTEPEGVDAFVAGLSLDVPGELANGRGYVSAEPERRYPMLSDDRIGAEPVLFSDAEGITIGHLTDTLERGFTAEDRARYLGEAEKLLGIGLAEREALGEAWESQVVQVAHLLAHGSPEAGELAARLRAGGSPVEGLFGGVKKKRGGQKRQTSVSEPQAQTEAGPAVPGTRTEGTPATSAAEPVAPPREEEPRVVQPVFYLRNHVMNGYLHDPDLGGTRRLGAGHMISGCHVRPKDTSPIKLDERTVTTALGNGVYQGTLYYRDGSGRLHLKLGNTFFPTGLSWKVVWESTCHALDRATFRPDGSWEGQDASGNWLAGKIDWSTGRARLMTMYALP
ncbi:hypothetical protein, partial [Kitasatospora sp. NPDC093102]|uniref:hypothetical protein n=1 Tax=Kitasatospora sp. NPDC093102 TaxID=3155069 RepID=UPI003423E4EB